MANKKHGNRYHQRQKELYGNWRVLAPDGEVLFLALEKRVNWYLSRNLAEKINGNTIRLTFEPKSRSNSSDPYIITEKLNKCVVCGTEELNVLTKHHIVPIEYRRLFPDVIKSRNCHDVVPICRNCHDVYEEVYASVMRQSLAEKYNAPICKGPIYNEILKSVSIAKLILGHLDVLPKQRFEQLCIDFSSFSNETPTLDNMYNYIEKWKDYKPLSHAEIVMNKVIECNELFDFVKNWRSDFINTMKPQYMPIHWSIERELKDV